MSDTIFNYSVPQLSRGLRVALALLDKAKAFAEEKSIDSTVLINDRLVATMYDFKKQIQIVSDTAKNAMARLSNQDLYNIDDSETTLDELSERIQKTLDYVNGFSADDFKGADTREVIMQMGPDRQGVFKSGEQYLQSFTLPNFYFHLTTAYNLLRKNGVEVGKLDFMGDVDIELRAKS